MTKEKEKQKKKKTTKKISKKDKKKWWRPSKYSRAIVRKLTAIFKIDWTVEEACLQAGISKETFYERYNKKEGFSDEFWENEHKRFKQEIDNARNYPFILAKKTLLKWAKQDPKYAIEFLKRRHKDYKDKISLENENEFEFDENELTD